MRQGNAYWAAVVILLAVGAYLLAPINRPEQSSTVGAVQTQDITYQGVEGKNALELLKASHQVESTTSDFGEFIVAIDGQRPDNQHFWAFYVNGQLAQEGAGTYQTKPTETIVWRLDKIQ